MKRDPRELVERFNCSVTAFIVAALLLFPSSTSQLCIAPGDHIAIESIGATCCTSPEISTPVERQPDNGFHAASDCHNCTDFFLASDVRVTASESRSHAAANPFAEECPQNHHSLDGFSSQCQSVGLTNNDRPISVPSSVPMRC
jgi:hypothetical protein